MAKHTREIDSDRADAATYRVRVIGALGDEWCRRARDMSLSVQRTESGGSVTELVGELPDEAALMGVLEALYTRGARLLSVERIDEDGTNFVKIEESQIKTDRPLKGATE